MVSNCILNRLKRSTDELCATLNDMLAEDELNARTNDREKLKSSASALLQLLLIHKPSLYRNLVILCSHKP